VLLYFELHGFLTLHEVAAGVAHGMVLKCRDNFIFTLLNTVRADRSGRAVEGMNRLRQLEHWSVSSNPEAWMYVCAIILCM
jgi:hypothetical protein